MNTTSPMLHCSVLIAVRPSIDYTAMVSAVMTNDNQKLWLNTECFCEWEMSINILNTCGWLLSRVVHSMNQVFKAVHGIENTRKH